MLQMFPCLTERRSASFGIWISSRGRRIQLDELFRLQGIDSRDVDWEGAGVWRSQMGSMLGNAMSLNVCERVLGNLLWSAGLVRMRPVDRWAANSVIIA